MLLSMYITDHIFLICGIRSLVQTRFFLLLKKGIRYEVNFLFCHQMSVAQGMVQLIGKTIIYKVLIHQVVLGSETNE